ncbi:AAA-domain-containing protein [Mytilinidion resinicola]|uniref:AAA-domain-containing protein n=1 Tax=Mytilinidion resinicola TaxID=574789 RepID=A0A6A6Z1R5_9PEZI|nr:AAA-domain-containing protein [Mytilinidion resinicola]KAF2815096.1 AAA-domain-containing protein [Mytilinidion resinicola]
MASHRRRGRPDDPLASDPEDGDWGAESSPRPQKRRQSRPAAGAKKRPQKRQRRYGSEDDIVSDEEEGDSASYESSIESEEDVEIGASGRPVRKAVKKEVKYEEKSSDDEIDNTSDEDRDELAPTPQKSRRPKPKDKKQSLIVKFKMPPTRRSTRARTGSKSSIKAQTPEVAIGTRRSSRLSHERDEPTIALSDSGKHVQVLRAGSLDPEPLPSRQTRGSKGLRNIPSAIMEASQENSNPTEKADTPGPLDNLLQGASAEVQASEAASPAESGVQNEDEDDDSQPMEGVVQDAQKEDSDEEPIIPGGRQLSSRAKSAQAAPPPARKRKQGVDESSDFEPPADEEETKGDDEMSESEDPKGRKNSSDDSGRRSTRLRGRLQASQRSRHNSDSEADSALDEDELAEEAAELRPNKRRRISRRGVPDNTLTYDEGPALRKKAKPDYRLIRPDLNLQIDGEDSIAPPPPVRGKGGRYRSLFSTVGPFGGGVESLIAGPQEAGALGGADSDSSDDDLPQPVTGASATLGGAVGMTPTAAKSHMFPQSAEAQKTTGSGGGPADFGKVKNKKALADADPLGVDPNVNFDGVGGLDDHINQLKEMVALPLLYPEVFQRFHVTPPRGVLFHGPPGTGKTLLARALASSVSSQGKKVTFYMRKGADALSKWVGEAERQLRLLFEEARKNQPSIIFFDEIDGLAPVRSSKQEQIHASIVATLLALMDGMDGRGQVIVIGATNRPDSVDPALRRPGRFDREFYFPLPNVIGRRAIIDIHTKNWEPPLNPAFKDQLAEVTKGYGGADLRALCTEAALNAVQGTYPQIYQSDKKLIIDPSTIKVLAKDFMISVNKMVPSSQRTVSSGAAPLPKPIAPLLRTPLEDIAKLLDEILPQKKKLTALEEAQFDDRDDEKGFERENMQRAFESSRIFRPRLLISGLQGMGQQYLGSALLNKFEGLHVQSFDLPTLLEDSARSPEAAIIQLFKEVRRHKPSVIYIPNVDVWYQTVEPKVIKTFLSLLRSVPPNDPVLLLGVLELGSEEDKPDPSMLRDLFGYSAKNEFKLPTPDKNGRREFFESLVAYIRLPPSDFPNPENRTKRKLPVLEVAPDIHPPIIQDDPKQAKLQKKRDRMTLNKLKMIIQPVMDLLKKGRNRFVRPIIPEENFSYLFDERKDGHVTSDLSEEQRQEQGMFRPYEVDRDAKGVEGIRHVETGNFFYNLDLTVIEQRLSNGYYKRFKDFLNDVKTLAKDAKTWGEQERILKANEMVANVEVDIEGMQLQYPDLDAECNALFVREQERARKQVEAAQKNLAPGEKAKPVATNVPPEISTSVETSGPIVLGEIVPGRSMPPVTPIRYPNSSLLSNGTSTGHDSHPQQSNGSNGPTHGVEDTHMTDSQPIDSGSHEFQTPSGPAAQTQKSQVSGRTFVAPNSHPGEYQNSASTTTSGQKTSDRSGRSSGPQFNTQSTNGLAIGLGPDFASMMPQATGSDMPDTQGTVSNYSSENPWTSSQSQPSQSSQPQNHMAAPPRQATSIPSILNNDLPQLILDEEQIKMLHEELVERSSGCSVEQLEQINAVLMDAIWKTRSEWNRNSVVHILTNAFNEVIQDIEHMQKLQAPSQDDDDYEVNYLPQQHRQNDRAYQPDLRHFTPATTQATHFR